MKLHKEFLLASTFFISLSAMGVPLWTRAVFETFAHGDAANSIFRLYVVKQEGLHLTGECSFSQPNDRNPPIAIVTGTDAGDAGFWPDITAQVKNDKGEWQTIAQPFNRGHRSSIKIKPGEITQKLPVALDVFLPVMDKYKIGRLVLNTGDATVFDLEMLLEPGVDDVKKP